MKWWPAEATKPNNDPLSHPTVHLLYSFLLPAADFQSNSSPDTCSSSAWSNLWADRMWPGDLGGFDKSREKKKKQSQHWRTVCFCCLNCSSIYRKRTSAFSTIVFLWLLASGGNNGQHNYNVCVCFGVMYVCVWMGKTLSVIEIHFANKHR